MQRWQWQLHADVRLCSPGVKQSGKSKGKNRLTHATNPGNEDDWGSSTLVIMRFCSCCLLSPVFRKKHPTQQQDVWVLAGTPALTQLSAQGAKNRTEHRCAKHCPISVVSQWSDFAPAMPEYSWQFFGSIFPILYKCLMVLGDVCCSHNFSPCHNAGQRLTEKTSLTMEMGDLSFTT